MIVAKRREEVVREMRETGEDADSDDEGEKRTVTVGEELVAAGNLLWQTTVSR